MEIIKPSLINTSFKEKKDRDAYGAELLHAFRDSNVNTLEHMRRGIDRLRLDESDFVPSIGKFVSWCKPKLSDYDLPSTEIAYRQAAVNAGKQMKVRIWSHMVVYHAALRTGMMDLNSQQPEKTMPRFKENYMAVFQDFIDGKILDEPKLLAKPEGGKVTSQAQALKNIQDIKGLFK